MPFPVVFDACVLAPYPLANLLLRLADEGIYRPLWSQDILIETRRTMVNKLGVPPDKADRRLNMMQEHFVDAEVSGYQEACRRDAQQRQGPPCARRRRAGTRRAD